MHHTCHMPTQHLTTYQSTEHKHPHTTQYIPATNDTQSNAPHLGYQQPHFKPPSNPRMYSRKQTVASRTTQQQIQHTIPITVDTDRQAAKPPLHHYIYTTHLPLSPHQNNTTNHSTITRYTTKCRTLPMTTTPRRAADV